MISQFIWKKKKPRVKLSTLQRGSTEGGLSVPNLEFYALAFSLRPLAVWFNRSIQTCWRGIEERIVHPYRLEDIVHSSISQKQAKKDFGPLIAHLIESWKGALKLSRTTTKWHHFSPIFHNHSLLSNSRPFSFPQWSERDAK